MYNQSFNNNPYETTYVHFSTSMRVSRDCFAELGALCHMMHELCCEPPRVNLRNPRCYRNSSIHVEWSLCHFLGRESQQKCMQLKSALRRKRNAYRWIHHAAFHCLQHCIAHNAAAIPNQ